MTNYIRLLEKDGKSDEKRENEIGFKIGSLRLIASLCT